MMLPLIDKHIVVVAPEAGQVKWISVVSRLGKPVSILGGVIYEVAWENKLAITLARYRNTWEPRLMYWAVSEDNASTAHIEIPATDDPDEFDLSVMNELEHRYAAGEYALSEIRVYITEAEEDVYACRVELIDKAYLKALKNTAQIKGVNLAGVIKQTGDLWEEIGDAEVLELTDDRKGDGVFEINLKENFLEEDEALQARSLEYKKQTFVVGMACLISCCVILLGSYILNSRSASLVEGMVERQREYTQLTDSTHHVQEKLSRLNEQLSRIYQLQNAQGHLAKLLLEISSRLPKSVWLTHLAFEKSKNGYSLALNGMALDESQLSVMLSNLTDDYQQVHLSFTEQTRVSDFYKSRQIRDASLTRFGLTVLLQNGREER